MILGTFVKRTTAHAVFNSVGGTSFWPSVSAAQLAMRIPIVMVRVMATTSLTTMLMMWLMFESHCLASRSPRVPQPAIHLGQFARNHEYLKIRLWCWQHCIKFLIVCDDLLAILVRDTLRVSLGVFVLFGLGFETQATWLRNNKETSSVPVRLCLRTHARKSQFNALKILPKLPTPRGGTKEGRGTLSPQAHHVQHQKCEGNWSAITTHKGLAAHVPSPSYLSPSSFSCCHRPSTVRKRFCCCGISTREFIWHSEHTEPRRIQRQKAP